MSFLNEQKDITDRIKERFQGLWCCTNKEYLHNVRIIMNYSSEIRHIIGRIAMSKDTAKVSGIKEVLTRALTEIKEITKEVNQ